jgi:TIR domain/Pentapeptide repeats (8 copies)
MAHPEHFLKLKEGGKTWNEWRKRNLESIPQLSGANLRGSDLTGLDLYEADLHAADLSRADLGGVDLRGANLRGSKLIQTELGGARLDSADLRGANLTIANLTTADLRGASLEGTNLRGTNFHGADLTNSDFENSEAGRTLFLNNDLSAVKGLESVRHFGPSTIGIDTIYRSQGKIPQVFLQGAGVPDDFIAKVTTLAANPIEFYSCFISYSTKDQDFAVYLHGDLQTKGVRCWFAPHDVQGGKKLHEQIDQAIRIHDRLLLILSSHSMNSEWVKTEIAKARKREIEEKQRILFPVRLVSFETLREWESFDADTGKDSAREIREYFIPDFTNWKDRNSYQNAFSRLLKDLKAKSSQ